MEPKYPLEKMNEVFKKVQDKEHWKNPINAAVKLTDEEVDICREAVIWYTGSVPEITPMGKPGRYRVVAAGYYLTIGA